MRGKNSNVSNMFLDEMEQEAITRIRKFAKIASAMEYEIGVGFSGGKDSLVVYNLKKQGLSFNQIAIKLNLDWGCVKRRYYDAIHDNSELMKGGEE